MPSTITYINDSYFIFLSDIRVFMVRSEKDFAKSTSWIREDPAELGDNGDEYAFTSRR